MPPTSVARQDPWCPGRCPITDSLSAMRAHFASDGFSYRPGLKGKSLCNLCSGRWLFIVSAGGRTGSTTVLNMLNMHPAFSLAGENNKQIDDVFELWMKAAYQKWRSAPWQRAAPNPASLLCLLQDWFVEISGAPNKQRATSSPPASGYIRGFKEIRWQATAQRLRNSAAFGPNVELPPLPPPNVSMLRFSSLLFPCSRFIFNTRETPSQLVRRVGRRRFGASHLAALSALHTEWGAAGRSYWLPLENFSVAGFNRLLRWLGETSCAYHDLLHSNEAGDMNARTPSASQRERVLPQAESAKCVLRGAADGPGGAGSGARRGKERRRRQVGTPGATPTPQQSDANEQPVRRPVAAASGSAQTAEYEKDIFGVWTSKS